MFRSLDWADLPESVRRYLEQSAIGPGDRIYVRKLNRLSDDALAAAAAQHPRQHRRDSEVAQALAKEFVRVPRTILRRLRRLRTSGTAPGADRERADSLPSD